MSGTFQLTIISAKLTHDTEVLGKMDPYLSLSLKSTRLKTKVHENAGKFPSWNQLFSFRSDEVSDVIEFSVWDHDALSKDDQIGIGFLSIAYLTNSLQRKEEWFPLTYKDKKAGEVLIAYQFFPDAKAPSIAPPMPYDYGFQGQPQPQGGIYPSLVFVPPQQSQPVFVPPQENQPVFIPQMPVIHQEPVVIHHEIPKNIVVFENDQKLNGHEYMNELYMKTSVHHPLDDIEKIVITGYSKDQGQAKESESSSWVEVVILDEHNKDQSERKTLYKNYQLNNYEKWTKTIDDKNMLKELKKKGNQVGIIARSIGSDWICEIKECRIEIHLKKNAEITKEKTLDFERKEMLHGKDNMNVLYLKTEIKGNVVKVFDIDVKGASKDQGWSSQDSSDSWIEYAVLNQKGEELTKRHKIIEHLKEKSFKNWDEKINDKEVFELLTKPGAQLAFYARSQYPGWICEVKEMTVRIHCLVVE